MPETCRSGRLRHRSSSSSSSSSCRRRFFASLASEAPRCRPRSLKRDFSLGGASASASASSASASASSASASASASASSSIAAEAELAPSALRRALALLDDADIALDFATYTALLRHCRKRESLQEGKRVHGHIARHGLQQDLYLGSLLILMYSDCGRPKEAHGVFKDMALRDELVFTIMLRAFARCSSGGSGGGGGSSSSLDALQTFQQMHEEGILGNKRIFISMFGLCSNREDVGEGKRMHSRFRSTAFGSDVATNTALINMYVRCGCGDPADSIFDAMGELDAIAWNVMISSRLEAERGSDALQLFRHMEHRCVTPTKVTFIHALDACGVEAALGKGAELHCRIMGSDVESDLMVRTALIDMYGKCGGLANAEKIFGRMTILDEVVWSAMISAHADNAAARSAIQLFEQMLQEGMLSNKYVLSSILSGCAAELLREEGRRMHARVACSGFALDVAVGNALVGLYGKIGRMEDALEVFHEMLECNLVSWNSIIGASAEQGHSHAAGQIFTQMQQQGFVADKATFVTVLSASAVRDSLAQGKRFHALAAAAAGASGDVQIDNALLNMYGKCGELSSVRSIFENMAAKNAVTWNTAISVHAQHGEDRVAFELFEDMQGRGIAPDRLTFSSILSMCANQGLLFEGKRIQELFKNRGFQPDKVVGSALISLYGKCGSLTEAEDVFDGMPEQDVVLWNSLITAFSQNGQGEYALELFSRMQRRQIRPSGITFVSVLSACSHVGLVDEACHHFAAMEECYGISPVVDHYNCMIDLLSRAGRLDEAEELLNAMTVKPTASSLMALLGACRNILDHVRGQRIAHKVFLIDPANPSPYVILSGIYAAVSEVQDATNVMTTTTTMIQGHAGVDCAGGYGDGMFGQADNSAELQAYLQEEACVA